MSSLSQAVRSPQRASELSMAPPVIENLRIVSAVWRDEWTGALFVERPGHSKPLVVEVRKGGLVVGSSARRLARGIAVGHVHFEARPVVGRGDRRILGRVIMAVSRAVSARIDKTLSSQAVVELAMPPERLAGCVSHELVDRILDHPAAVGVLVRDGSATVAELRALGWLGIVRVRHARSPRTVPPNQRRRHGARDSASGGSLIGKPRLAAAPVVGFPDVTNDPTPRVDRRPIAMPEVDTQGLSAEKPMVHLGMRRAWSSTKDVQRIDGVAFGQDQDTDELPAGLLETSAEDTADLTDDALLSGVDDELADVLSEEELAVLLGLSAARVRPPPQQDAAKLALARNAALDTQPAAGSDLSGRRVERRRNPATSPVESQPPSPPPPASGRVAFGAASPADGGGYELGSLAAECRRRPKRDPSDAESNDLPSRRGRRFRR